MLFLRKDVMVVMIAIIFTILVKSSCLSMQKQIVEFFNETDGVNLLWSDPANYQTTLNYEINSKIQYTRVTVYRIINIIIVSFMITALHLICLFRRRIDN